jgi:Tfp pilus assembly protein PilX
MPSAGFGRPVCDAVAAHERAFEDFELVLEPGSDTVERGDTIAFELANRSERRFATNFYNWRLDKRVDGEWFHVAPQEYPEPLTALAPDEMHTWRLTAAESAVAEGESVDRSGETGTEDLSVEALGGGTYAFRTRGWFADDRDDGTYAFGATFDLDAPALSITRTDAITETRWEDETLLAESDRGDPEAGQLGAYELRRVGDAPDEEVIRLIAEQVLRNDQLRDAVALAVEYDADTARIEEYTGITPVFGADSDGYYEVGGTVYEVTTEAIDEATIDLSSP